MATAAVQVPSYNRVEPGSKQLIPATYPNTNALPEVDFNKITSEWLGKLNNALSGQDYDAFKYLFFRGSSWRDQLGLSWDYHTLNGPEKIISFLKSRPNGNRIESIQIDNSKFKPHASPVDFNGKINSVAAFLTIETDIGRGRGIVRLLEDKEDGGKWKAFTLFTAMHELKGHEETVRNNRPNGVDHGGKPGRKNWQERRTAMENFDGEIEPTVLILGNQYLPSRGSRKRHAN